MIPNRTPLYRVLLSTAAFCLAVKAADIALGRYASPAAPATVAPGIFTFELFPYEGWHLPAHFTHRGDLIHETQPYKDYEIETGPMGYFIDFDLEHPPAKAKDEYRVILTGGSGAQGWGARTNDLMLHRQLERTLNARLKGRLHARVINLAMAGTVAYQNFITLNRYAHPLKPDLILSYIGYNEFEQLFKSRSDSYFQFPELNALILAARPSESGRGPAWLRRLFPHLLRRTDYADDARRRYEAERGVAYSAMSNRDFVKATAVDQSVLALQSIKRDFSGIPIVLAWQAGGEWVEDFARRNGLPADFYDRAFADIERELAHSINDDWAFINVHARFERDPKPYIGVHLGNQGHEIVAGLLADKIMGFARKDRRVTASN